MNKTLAFLLKLVLALAIAAPAPALCLAGRNPDSDYLVAFKPRKSKFYGYRDARTGETVLEPAYKEANLLFNEGLAVVSHMENGKAVKKKYDIIRPDGSVVFTVQADQLPSGYGEDGWLWMDNVRFDREGNLQRLPENFRGYAASFLYPDQTDEAPDWCRAKVYKHRGTFDTEPLHYRFGYVDYRTMEVKIPFEYDVLGEFHDGLAVYRQGKESGFLDSLGRKVHVFPGEDPLIIPFSTDEYFVDNVRFDNNRLWCRDTVNDENNKLRYALNLVALDRSFERAIEPENKIADAQPFSNGLAVVCFKDELKDKHWWRGTHYGKVYIDTLGRVVSPQSYFNAKPFIDYGEGRVLARVDNGDTRSSNYGFIDRDFNYTVPCVYSYTDLYFRDWGEGRLGIRVIANKHWGVIDSNNNTIIPCIYDRMMNFYNGRTVAERKIDGRSTAVILNLDGEETRLEGDPLMSYGDFSIYKDRDLIVYRHPNYRYIYTSDGRRVNTGD